MLNFGKTGAQIGQQHVSGSVYNTYHLQASLSDPTKQSSAPTDALQQKIDFRQSCLRSLDFASSDERLSTVKTAHKSTCHWLLSRAEFGKWLDQDLRKIHHGFLWIKGKPGTGKSTLMKFILMQAFEDPTYGTIITFFFNARGDELGRNAQGLYQSLLLQLVAKLPETQKVFDRYHTYGSAATPRWTTDVLQSAIQSTFTMVKGKTITCLVDALDECDGNDLRGMIRFFEELSETAISHDVRLRICLSSRHFPYVTVRYGLRLVLEDQPEHGSDIGRYIDSELQLGDPSQLREIREKMLQKARGNFLWIRLVVQMLNVRWDQGRVRGLQQLLDLIPEELEKLFDGIIESQDKQDDSLARYRELDLCVRWILYAYRPLKLDELYLAILVAIEQDIDIVYESQRCDEATMERFILNCSKGLVEITKSKEGTVQFIHETVREYFMKRLERQEHTTDSHAATITRSHELMKTCCQIYIAGVYVEVITLQDHQRDKLPLLDYAVQYVFDHSNAADHTNNSQAQFLLSFDFDRWLTLHKILNLNQFTKSRKTRTTEDDPSRLYILAAKGLSALVRYEVQNTRQIEFSGSYAFPLMAALENGHAATLEAILSPPEAASTGDDAKASQLKNDIAAAISFLFVARRSLELPIAQEYKNPLMFGAEQGCAPLVRCLLATGKISVDRGWEKGQSTALTRAAACGHLQIVKLLIDAGASLSPSDDEDDSPLVVASIKGFVSIVDTIILAHFERSMPNQWLDTALVKAAENGQQVVVRLLLDAGADINTVHEIEGTALITATRNCQKLAVMELLKDRPNVNFLSQIHGTALMTVLDQDLRHIFAKLCPEGVEELFETRLLQDFPSIAFVPKSYNELFNEAQHSWSLLEDMEEISKVRGGKKEQNGVPLGSAKKHEFIRSWFERRASIRRVDIVTILLEAGADPNVRGASDASRTHNLTDQTPLAIAALHGYSTEVNLLLSAGARVDEQVSQEATPLILAARENHEDVVCVFIVAGANLNLSCPFPGTALSAAGLRGHVKIVQLLLDSGANVDAPAGDFGSALIAVASRGKLDIVQLLLAHGADVHVRSEKYGTALHIARKRNYDEVSKLLMNYGANDET